MPEGSQLDSRDGVGVCETGQLEMRGTKVLSASTTWQESRSASGLGILLLYGLALAAAGRRACSRVGRRGGPTRRVPGCQRWRGMRHRLCRTPLHSCQAPCCRCRGHPGASASLPRRCLARCCHLNVVGWLAGANIPRPAGIAAAVAALSLGHRCRVRLRSLLLAWVVLDAEADAHVWLDHNSARLGRRRPAVEALPRKVLHQRHLWVSLPAGPPVTTC